LPVLVPVLRDGPIDWILNRKKGAMTEADIGRVIQALRGWRSANPRFIEGVELGVHSFSVQ
jgi:hypothetical protein